VRDRWDTARTEAFSDGVFAIAVTLLVLDLSVPESDLDHLWRGIAHQWPSYLGFATSFITIGGLWLGHHGLFRRMEYVNNDVMRVNLLLLMAVSFLPFPTHLLAETINRSESSERAAVIFYGASLLVISCLFAILWRVAARDRKLLKSDVTDAEVNAIGQATTPSLGFYIVLTALAFIAPKVAAFGYLVIAIVSVLRARSGKSSPQPATD
jgi:uncharacterized membrane protein